MEDYRKKYKEHYDIDFGSEYAIHHIDGNRKNNDISNLLLMPEEIHSEYHIRTAQFKTVVGDGLETGLGFDDYKFRIKQFYYFQQVLDILEQADKWITAKMLADYGDSTAYQMFKRGNKNGRK